VVVLVHSRIQTGVEAVEIWKGCVRRRALVLGLELLIAEKVPADVFVFPPALPAFELDILSMTANFTGNTSNSQAHPHLKKLPTVEKVGD
jgi:hypothetical protein